MKILRICFALTLGLLSITAQSANSVRVKMDTTLGAIVLELSPDKAPATVKNFLNYAQSGFYDGTIFHRVIPGFMIQGGGFEPGMKRKKATYPIKNESDNGLSNVRGTIAMARTDDPHSATAQFFINQENNTSLDYRAGQWGYTVFGQVISGLEVVDRIAAVDTSPYGYFMDVPKQLVVIQKVTVLDQ